MIQVLIFLFQLYRVIWKTLEKDTSATVVHSGFENVRS